MNQELTVKNFKRISIINWMLSVPFFVLFAWPYWFIGRFSGLDQTLIFVGCALFSIPFMITILHGHVTLALGEAHRHHYYDWLVEQPLTYGLFFHPMIIRTRFRLILLVISLLIFLLGLVLPI
ncbi:MAG: hypothetical protein ACQEST_03910 [Bacteroidota bacterium]